MQIQVGIITISDRASAGDYEDLGGPALKGTVQAAGWHVLAEAIVPDDAARILEIARTVETVRAKQAGWPAGAPVTK